MSFTASRTNAVAHGLTNGKCYFFRVAAENAIGVGPFVETAAEVVIKEPISEFQLEKLASFTDVLLPTQKAPLKELQENIKAILPRTYLKICISLPYQAFLIVQRSWRSPGSQRI